MLVWDALAEEAYGQIDYWLKTIQSFAAESPIIIVVNKCGKNIGRIRRIGKEDYRILITNYPKCGEKFDRILKIRWHNL